MPPLHKTVSRISASLSTSSSCVAISREQPNAALIVYHRIGGGGGGGGAFYFVIWPGKGDGFDLFTIL